MKKTITLIILNTIIFFLEPILPIKLLAFTPALFLYYPWTIITSLFLHANFAHLFYNMIALFFFGSFFETWYGERRFLKLYFLSGILGNIAYLLYDPNSMIPGVGASGCIYGIIGALAILHPRMIVYVNFIPVPLIFLAILWLMVSIIGTIFPYGMIAHQAHLAGLLFGFLYGYMLKKKGYAF